MCSNAAPGTHENQIYPEELVLRVNEVYHDVEGRLYEEIHPEIFVDERKRWEQIGAAIGEHSEGVTVLDVGTGTGFVPMTIGRFLKRNDRVICSDISAKMLQICERNIAGRDFLCDFEYLKLDGRSIPVDSGVDWILLNSVLHHIPDMAHFFAEADKVLKVGGSIVLAHEPNKHFYSHSFLWRNYRLLSALAAPKSFAGAVLRRVGLMERVRGLYSAVSATAGEQAKVLNKVNEILLAEGAIDIPFTSSQITEIVDIHSPTAGGHHKGRGIDIDAILTEYLPNFTVARSETYNYLGNLPTRNRVMRSYESFLSNRYTGRGSTIVAVLRKECEANH